MKKRGKSLAKTQERSMPLARDFLSELIAVSLI